MLLNKSLFRGIAFGMMFMLLVTSAIAIFILYLAGSQIDDELFYAFGFSLFMIGAIMFTASPTKRQGTFFDE